MQRNHLAVRREYMGLTFPVGCFIRSRIDDTSDNWNGAAHPKFIKPGAVHVVWIVRLVGESYSSARCAECATGIAVQQLQHAIVLVEARIED